MDGTHIKKKKKNLRNKKLLRYFEFDKAKLEIRHLKKSVAKSTIKDFLRHLMPLYILSST